MKPVPSICWSAPTRMQSISRRLKARCTTGSTCSAVLFWGLPMPARAAGGRRRWRWCGTETRWPGTGTSSGWFCWWHCPPSWPCTSTHTEKLSGSLPWPGSAPPQPSSSAEWRGTGGEWVSAPGEGRRCSASSCSQCTRHRKWHRFWPQPSK